ncbi:MAG TPA: hypothetical protein VK194_01120, partial [Candidatus Deferrimicrobium sp.]|nr:hypothetical protein [Candidatus Deferrimicrobium sp.]
MEHRGIPPSAEPAPLSGTAAHGDHAAGAGGADPADLHDPRALQILSTEHWSLLATRSMSWNESF